MKGVPRTTRDHRKIRSWIERRGGAPALSSLTEPLERHLDIDFSPGQGGEIKSVTWEEFFRRFDEGKLIFVYEETTESGHPSRFFQFVSAEDEDLLGDEDEDLFEDGAPEEEESESLKYIH